MDKSTKKKNMAMLIVLVAMVVLLFSVSIVKMTGY